MARVSLERGEDMAGLDSAVLSMILPVAMLIVGFVLVVVEMYIPGIGAPGILGVLLLAGGVWALQPTPFQALMIIVAIVLLLCIALSVCIHSASKGRLSKSSMVLHETATPQEAQENPLTYYVGMKGRAITVLRPSGMAMVNGVKLNVVSDGEFIDADAEIIVTNVDGNRICVRRAVNA